MNSNNLSRYFFASWTYGFLRNTDLIFSDIHTEVYMGYGKVELKKISNTKKILALAGSTIFTPYVLPLKILVDMERIEKLFLGNDECVYDLATDRKKIYYLMDFMLN